MEARDLEDTGFDRERLARLSTTIESDIAAERYDGCELIVGRGDTVVYHEHFGWADRKARRRVERDQPFITMSVGKQFVAALVLNRVTLRLAQPKKSITQSRRGATDKQENSWDDAMKPAERRFGEKKR